LDAREFDELISRIASASSRRKAVKGVLGGALAGVGVAAAADIRAEGKKGRKGVSSEHNARNGKRTICLCQEAPTTTVTTSEEPTTVVPQRQARELVCETKRFKKKKAKRKLRNNPGSYRGPCQSTTTSTSTEEPTTTETTSGPTTTTTTEEPTTTTTMTTEPPDGVGD
jgi:hypothetical protein